MSAVIEQARLNFRPMLESDLEEVMLIEKGAYDFPWTRKIFQDCLRVGYCCWVLESDGALISYGVMSINVDECHLLNICVHQQSQGCGYGQIMLDYLMDQAGVHQANVVFLEVRPSNVVAKRMYSNVGFDEVGMRPNYYPAVNGREDALIMARSLL